MAPPPHGGAGGARDRAGAAGPRNSEPVWTTVHPLLAESGRECKACRIGGKGIGPAAGNAGAEALRKLPVTTERPLAIARPALAGIEEQHPEPALGARIALPCRMPDLLILQPGLLLAQRADIRLQRREHR